MLGWISILGGLLIMMGQHTRAEALFYYFRLEDQVPETHLLRLIEKHISFAFVREKLKASYSETGRPSIDPELLLRMLLIGYLYGITSERKLVEELRMHLAWRWFTGLGFDQEIPHHSTFSKNRHGRFQESKLFEQLFEEIVARCLEVGLVQGDNLSVDGSFVEANASKESRIPREQLGEAAQVDIWEPQRRLGFSIHADSNHIPPTTLDEHVKVGGAYFDVLHGEYVLEPRPGGMVRLRLISRHRVSTDFNWYARFWTDAVMRDVQRSILYVLRKRCEAASAPSL